MKIGIDLDGVGRTSMLGELHLMHQLRDRGINVDVHKWAKVQQGQIWPLLNPGIISLPEDEIYFITAATLLKDKRRKQRWVKHFFGRGKVIGVQVLTGSAPMAAWGKTYVDKVSEIKLEIMQELGIEVYIDEDPEIVRKMRKIIEAHDLKIKVLHYGPWIEGLY